MDRRDRKCDTSKRAPGSEAMSAEVKNNKDGCNGLECEEDGEGCSGTHCGMEEEGEEGATYRTTLVSLRKFRFESFRFESSVTTRFAANSVEMLNSELFEFLML